MEIVKKMSLKMKALAGLVLAGLVVAVVAFKKYVTDGLSSNELQRQEEALAADAGRKLAEKQAALDAQKASELEALNKKQEAERNALEASVVAEKNRLDSLAKKDKKAFKKEVEKKLGVREKKTPGRKPKGR